MNSEPLRAAWAVPLATVNEVRAHMESAFKAIVAQMLDAHAESVAIAERANKRAADIESAAQAAAQRARLESDIELGHSNDLVERLQTELQRLREQLHLDANRGEPDHADAGTEMSEREAAHRSEVIALREELQASRAECTDLAHQIELEKAKHARLIAGVRSIQQTKPPAALIGFVNIPSAWERILLQGIAIESQLPIAFSYGCNRALLWRSRPLVSLTEVAGNRRRNLRPVRPRRASPARRVDPGVPSG